VESVPGTDHHTEYVIRRLAADVFPVLGHLPITEVTTPKLVAMAKKIEARGALDIAKRALQTCGQIFRYAIAYGYVQHNAASAIKPSDVLKTCRKENYSRVEPKELPELLRTMAVYDGSPHTRAALQLIALTSRGERQTYEPIWRVKARQEGRLRTRSTEKTSPAATRTRETALAVWVKLAQALVRSLDAKDRQLAAAIARYVHQTPAAIEHTRKRQSEKQRELPGMQLPSRAVPERTRARPELERVRTGPEIER
jgi:hypothetical protein